MLPSAKISNEDVTEVYTPILAIDAIWEDQYGRDIEYEFRIIPAYLVYLLKKYELVPHWLMVDNIAEICKVGVDKADQLITEAVKLGLISVKAPDGDRRHRFYFLSQDQKDKLLNVRRGEAMAYSLAHEQMKQPDNLEAGRTEENKAWYRNAMQRVLRYDDRYRHNVERLKKLKHLLFSLAVAAVLASTWFIELAAATADKGGG